MAGCGNANKQTVTHLVDNRDNSATYTNEDGTQENFKVRLSADNCQGAVERTDGLFVPNQNTRKFNRAVNTSAIAAPVAAAAGQVYHTVTLTLTGNDDCFKSQTVNVNYFWSGFNVQLTAAGSIRMLPEHYDGSNWVAASDYTEYGIADGTQHASAGFFYNNYFTLNYGATRTVGCRWKVANASGAQFSNSTSIYTNGFTVDRERVS